MIGLMVSLAGAIEVILTAEIGPSEIGKSQIRFPSSPANWGLQAAALHSRFAQSRSLLSPASRRAQPPDSYRTISPSWSVSQTPPRNGGIVWSKSLPIGF